MPEPLTTASPPQRAGADFVPVAVNLLAAFLTGSMFLPLAFLLGLLHPLMFTSLSVFPDDAERAVLLLLGLAVSVTSLRRLGWVLSAAGIGGEVWLLYEGVRVVPEAAVFPLLAVALGLHLGGMLAAFAVAGTASRWACAIGLGVGLVAGGHMYGTLPFAPAGRPDLASVDGVLLSAIAGLVLVCGLALLRPGHRVAAARTAWLGPVIGVVAAAVVGRVLTRVWTSQTGNPFWLGGQWGGMSETTDRLVRTGIAGLIALILLAVAYRRGGPDLARWVMVGFALGVTGLAPPPVFRGNVLLVVVIPAVVGALAAAAAARWADHWLPADAAGVALAAALIPFTPESPDPLDPQVASATVVAGLAFAYGLALTAGLTRLTGATGPDTMGPGVTGAAVVGSAALGFAALILTEQVLRPPGVLIALAYPTARETQSGTLAVAALALLTLFGLRALGHRNPRTSTAPPTIPVSTVVKEGSDA